MNRMSLLKIIFFSTLFLSASGCQTQHPPTDTLNKPVTLQALEVNATSSTVWQNNAKTIWDTLRRSSSRKLTLTLEKTQDLDQQAWLKLALISKEKHLSTAELITILTDWRNTYPNHPGNELIPSIDTLTTAANAKPPQHIAIMLPYRGLFASSGQSIREGLIKAYYKRPASENTQTIKFYDTTSVNTIASLYQQAVADGADFIIGPLLKPQVEVLASNTPMIPTLALNYTNQSLPANFYEFGLLPEDEAVQIADRAHESGLFKAIVIVPDSAWGTRISKEFSARWAANGGEIVATWLFKDRPTFNSQIAQLLQIDLAEEKKLMHEANNRDALQQLRRHDFDVIFLFAQPQDARSIVPLLRFYYVKDVPIFATSSVYAGIANPAKDKDLNGVTVCDTPWTLKSAREANNLLQSNRLYAVGQDAYLISQSLTRMKLLSNFPVYGATGALSLTTSQQIHRRLPCATFDNGLLQTA